MDSYSFNVLSVCAGIGGLDLGLRIAVPNARTVCYLEREAFAVEVLAARMREGSMDEAPVWTDLATFDGKPWRGVVDCIAAGLPCQPYSVAGKQRGDADERYIWPDFFRIVQEVAPAMVFIENVPGLVTWFRPVGEKLCGLGYELEAGIFSAAEVGRSHKRERIFVLAHSGSARLPRSERQAIFYQGRLRQGRTTPELCEVLDGEELLTPPPPESLEFWEGLYDAYPKFCPTIEPGLRRVVNGSAPRMDRIRAIGNSVVPLQAAYALETLLRRMGKSLR